MGALFLFQTPRGRAQLRDGRERFNLLPKGGRRGRYFYAVGFANGRTKIGIAQRPRSRICAHWIASECSITWAHVFALCTDPRIEHIERLACSLAAQRSPRVRRTETFIGLSRDDALSCVREAIATFAGA